MKNNKWTANGDEQTSDNNLFIYFCFWVFWIACNFVRFPIKLNKIKVNVISQLRNSWKWLKYLIKFNDFIIIGQVGSPPMNKVDKKYFVKLIAKYFVSKFIGKIPGISLRHNKLIEFVEMCTCFGRFGDFK